MSSVSAATPAATIETTSGMTPARRRRAAVAIGAHFVVDIFSFIGIALLPLLAVMLEIRPEQKALLLASGSVCSGVVQPVVAWASDRHDSRVIGTLGFVVAVLCIGNLGAAQTFTQLAVLYSVGAMGVGAFHPPAAATVGRLGGTKRSVYVAFFFLAGMLGGIVGNVFTPMYVDWMTPVVDGVPDTAAGILAIRWFIPIGLLGALILALAIHGVAHRDGSAHDHHVAWDAAERKARWGAVWILYAGNVLRFSVNLSLIYLFTEWADAYVSGGAGSLTKEQGIEASGINGRLQASMQVGMGTGGIALGFLLAPRLEKLSFTLFPLLGAVMICSIPFIGRAEGAHWVVMGAGVLSGVGFGSLIPISMSVAQRLLPHRTSLASGLMLGGAWMLAFMGPILAELVQNGTSKKPTQPGFIDDALGVLPRGMGDAVAQGFGLDTAFFVAGGALAVAGMISLFLPTKLLVRSAR